MFWDARDADGGLCLGSPPNSDRDTDANLDAKYVVCCPAKLRIFSNVAVQIDVVDARKLLANALAKTIESNLVNKAVVTYKADQSVTAFQTVRSPSKEFHVRVV